MLSQKTPGWVRRTKFGLDPDIERRDDTEEWAGIRTEMENVGEEWQGIPDTKNDLD